MRTASAPTLLGRALRWLSAREYTRAELAQRLGPFEEAPGQVQTVLDTLEQKGFLSDARAAQSLVHRRQGKLGSARIGQELRQKGVAPELLRDTLESLRATERERAQAVWIQKFGVPATDRAGQMRQMRFLAARGFATETIRQVVPRPTGVAALDTDDVE
ncbi:recombination regulator RecX [Curvibacter sp. APW13]|uniref:recombination regulator RecX n=1 Tax=Curvibacter sp. APW13 TaxID=3077236 RepID=UPI0028DED949|nr:recombination regulator RecX [Curvibacter sp. APW13]MDT8990151.1 recombination regulator RecX [Curvibacter sp. APW13]